MASPFDQLLNLKIENQSDAIRTAKFIPENHVSTQRNIPFTDKTVSFSIHGRTLERLVYILIILSLASYIFYDAYKSNPVGQINGIQDISGNVVQQPSSEITVTKSAPLVEEQKNTAQAENLTANVQAALQVITENKTEQVENKTATPVEVKPQGEKDFLTYFDMYIEDAQTERNPETDKLSKILSLKIMINNNWKTFKPRVEVFWYDKGSNEILKNKVRANVELQQIKEGEIQHISIDQFDSNYLTPFYPEETIEIRIYNSDTNMLLKSAELKIN